MCRILFMGMHRHPRGLHNEQQEPGCNPDIQYVRSVGPRGFSLEVTNADAMIVG